MTQSSRSPLQFPDSVQNEALIDTLKPHIDFVLDQVHQRGGQGDLIVQASDAFSLSAHSGKIDQYKVVSSQVMGLRLIHENRVATLYSESFDEKSLTQMVEQAFQNSRYSKIDEHQVLSAPTHTVETQVDGINQSSSATVEEKIELALSLERDLTALPLASQSPYNGFGESSSTLILANTQGTLGLHQEASTYCYTSALCEDQGQNAMFSTSSQARRFEDLDAAHCIQHSYEVAKALLNGSSLNGSYSVCFTVDMLSSLFRAFTSCLLGSSAVKGINPWKDKIGEAVADARFTLWDRVNMPSGFAIQAFDDEGFTTQDLCLIDQGQLCTLMHNSKTAKYLNQPHNAHASRSPKGGLGVGSHHLVIEPPSSTSGVDESGLWAGEVLEIIELQGLHSGTDAISGDFSLGANGFLYRNGERVQAVRGITVAGNFYKMLNEIEVLGSQREASENGCFFAPKIRFASLKVAG